MVRPSSLEMASTTDGLFNIPRQRWTVSPWRKSCSVAVFAETYIKGGGCHLIGRDVVSNETVPEHLGTKDAWRLVFLA